MQFNKMFPMVACDKLDETRDFYTGLGFETEFYNGWYLHLSRPGEPSVEIGFVAPGHESQPPAFQGRFAGDGLFFGFVVDDAQAVYDEMTAQGRKIVVEIRDEPWGQRHFAIHDPNGIVIDIISGIEPDAAWMAAQPNLAETPVSV